MRLKNGREYKYKYKLWYLHCHGTNSAGKEGCHLKNIN